MPFFFLRTLALFSDLEPNGHIEPFICSAAFNFVKDTEYERFQYDASSLSADGTVDDKLIEETRRKCGDVCMHQLDCSGYHVQHHADNSVQCGLYKTAILFDKMKQKKEAKGLLCVRPTPKCNGMSIPKGDNNQFGGRDCKSQFTFESTQVDADDGGIAGDAPSRACTTEALAGDKDAGYRGCQTHTSSGKECQKWNVHSPHSHRNITPNNTRNKGLGDHNYCRNPDAEDTIWCYTTDPDTRWEYCSPLKQLPACFVNVQHPIHPNDYKFVTQRFQGYNFSAAVSFAACSKCP
jgi:integrin beta 3